MMKIDFLKNMREFKKQVVILQIKLKELLLENKEILRENRMLISQLLEAKIKYNEIKAYKLNLIDKEDKEKNKKIKKGI